MAAPMHRPLWQRFLLFLVPLMISNILQSLSGTVNSIYIGQLLGVEALAAVSTFFPIMILLISFIVGLASGSTVLIGQAFGARNIEKVKQVTGTTITSSFILGIVVAFIGIFFTEPLMRLLGAPENVLQQSVSYGRIVLIGMPGFFIFLIVTSVLRGVGDTVTPMISLVLSIAVGLVVTPALILGWFGLPQIGVDAAAVAFIAGFMAVLVFLFFYLRARNSPLAPDAALLRDLRINLPLLGTILRLGIPAGVQMIVSSLAAIVVVGVVNRFGSNATAAYGAVNQVLSYIQFPAMSIAIATSIFGAQAIGAGQTDQLRRIVRTALMMNLIITGALVIVAYVFSQHLVALFITSPEVMEITETLLHIVLWSTVLFGFASVFSGMMRASGDVIVPMVLSLACILIVELPLALFLSRTSLGLSGIWWAYAASFTTMLLLQSGYYWFFWKNKPIKKLI
ncbi:MAG: MATE family efflux transporter [Devosia sp.]|uniref:MATE family efflux transporter n=1 Tax=Devosia sp. TaxID=1871048 RepID=UPI001A4A049B|nr:MATE family efflux transporter [Devosia sp.]MBL8598353.1 MATE family efflux transporter [Devosia sp.]